jgi:hypothetical protein
MPEERSLLDVEVLKKDLELWKNYHERDHATHLEAHIREHAATEEALNKAAAAMEKRLEGMNEFRDQLKTQAASFITRDVFDAKMQAMQDQLGLLRDEHVGFMSTERFEREHKALIDKIDDKFASYDLKLVAEEKVTVRQDAQQALLDKLATSNRWMMGVAVSSGLSLLAIVLHLIGAY